MLKLTKTYTDYDGNERTEDFYFNLSKAELTKMEFSEDGGLIKFLEKIIAAQDGKTIMDTFEKIILMSYGEKSLDGKRFIKNDEVREAFSQTEAYSEIFMDLVTDDTKAIEFVNGIMPKEAQMTTEEMKAVIDAEDPREIIEDAKKKLEEDTTNA